MESFCSLVTAAGDVRISFTSGLEPVGTSVWNRRLKTLEVSKKGGSSFFVMLLKPSSFHETQNFIISFTRTSRWSVFWAQWMQSTSSHSIFLHPILILYSHLYQVPEVMSSLQSPRVKSCKNFLLFLECCMPHPSISSCWSTNYKDIESVILSNFLLCTLSRISVFSPAPCAHEIPIAPSMQETVAWQLQNST